MEFDSHPREINFDIGLVYIEFCSEVVTLNGPHLWTVELIIQISRSIQWPNTELSKKIYGSNI